MGRARPLAANSTHPLLKFNSLFDCAYPFRPHTPCRSERDHARQRITDRLIAELHNLEDTRPRALTKDLRTSFACWEIEQLMRAGLPVDNESNRRLTIWVKTFIDVDTLDPGPH